MATKINFTKGSDENRYHYSYTSDGNSRVFQIDFNESVGNGTDRAFVDVFARADSGMDNVLIGSLDVYNGKNRMFQIEVPKGASVTIETALEVKLAKYITIA